MDSIEYSKDNKIDAMFMDSDLEIKYDDSKREGYEYEEDRKTEKYDDLQ